MWPVVLVRVRADVIVNALFSQFMNLDSSLLRGAKATDWFFRTLVFKGAARPAKLGTSRRNKLHKLQEKWSYVTIVGQFNPVLASIVCDAIFRRLV